MAIPYDQQGDFLSAWADIIIRPPLTRSHPEEYRTRALVDTGAHMTHVHNGLMHHLGLSAENTVRAEGFGGTFACDVYAVSLEIIKPNGHFFHPIVRVYASDRYKFVLGMNVLRGHVSTFDGPQLLLDIQP